MRHKCLFNFGLSHVSENHTGSQVLSSTDSSTHCISLELLAMPLGLSRMTLTGTRWVPCTIGQGYRDMEGSREHHMKESGGQENDLVTCCFLPVPELKEDTLAAPTFPLPLIPQALIAKMRRECQGSTLVMDKEWTE